MRYVRDFVCLAVALLLTSYAAQAQAPSKPADAKAIAALITQLGSADFQERQAATRSLEAIGRPALAALREAADKNADAEISRRAKGLVEKIENGLEQLLEDYKSYGLPLPPKDAPLVRFQSGGGFLLNGVLQPKIYTIGFLLEQETKKDKPLVLRGTTRHRPDPPVIPIDPVKAERSQLEGWVKDSRYELLPLAIQCKARGWEALAKQLLLEAQHADKRLPRTEIRRRAWEYWELELSSPKCDWSVASRHLHSLIRSSRELESVPHRALLKSLDLSLVPSKSKPGSIDALVDDLINVRHVYFRVGPGPDPNYVRLVEMGFSAVPALIEHLDDDRLTRYRSSSINNFRGYQYRVGHVVSELLEDLSGESLGDSSLRALQGYTGAKDKALAWWNEAKKIGEEAHVMAHVLPEDGESPNQHLLWLLMKRHSKRLPEVYRTLLTERPKMESWSIAYAVAHCDLPLSKKVDLLAEAARHKMLECRESALEQLADLDQAQFVRLFMELLDELPKTLKGIEWLHSDSRAGYLALQTDDVRVWKALEKAVRRVNVNSRIGILHKIAWYGDEGKHRKRMAIFMAVFLDDDSAPGTRKNSGRSNDVQKKLDFLDLDVPNHAAMEIGRLLKLERTPEPTWDDKQWAQFRDEVREALKRSLLGVPRLADAE